MAPTAKSTTRATTPMTEVKRLVEVDEAPGPAPISERIVSLVELAVQELVHAAAGCRPRRAVRRPRARPARPLSLARMFLHQLQDLLGIRVLGDVVVRARLEAPETVPRLVPAGEDHDGHGLGRGLRLEEAAGLIAVHARHHHVEDDEVHALGESLLDGLQAVAGRRPRRARPPVRIFSRAAGPGGCRRRSGPSERSRRPLVKGR